MGSAQSNSPTICERTTTRGALQVSGAAILVPRDAFDLGEADGV